MSPKVALVVSGCKYNSRRIADIAVDFDEVDRAGVIKAKVGYLLLLEDAGYLFPLILNSCFEKHIEICRKDMSKGQSRSPPGEVKSTPVSRVMIPRQDMFVKTGPADTLKVADVLGDMDKAKKGDRVPILGAKGEAQCIFHRSLIDRFLSGQARSGKSAAEINAFTMGDLLKDADLRKVADAYGIVKLDSNLSDAADAMNKIDHCQDVFVTQTGAKDESVLGWITNVIVQDNAKV
jgi:hypothetical protein